MFCNNRNVLLLFNYSSNILLTECSEDQTVETIVSRLREEMFYKKKIIILSNRDLPAEEKAKEQVKALISLMHPILISAVAG